MPLVVDSSALITLAAGDALDLLASWHGEVYTVREVYQETVEAGSLTAYPGAAAIRRCFEDEVIFLRSAGRRPKIPGLSETDSLVISLALETSARRLLSNDRLLRRRAEERGVDARFTIELVQELFLAGKCSLKRRDRLFEAFVETGRYSRPFVHAFRLAIEG